MKSLYQNEEFARFWNERAGETGEIYKRLVLDPLMFELVGSFQGKRVLELGCGNGYLTSRFIEQDPASVTLLDISAHNLAFAKEKCPDPRIKFIEQDATEPWQVENNGIDVVYSTMMLNEVENIAAPMKEACRVLSPGGVFVFSVIHPAWDLFIFAQEQVGRPSNKIQGLGGYFRRGHAKYLMGGDSKTKPELADKYKKTFEVEHYQRPLSDYVNGLLDAGFVLKRMLEPQLPDELLRESPRFAEYKDHPIGLILYAVKESA